MRWTAMVMLACAWLPASASAQWGEAWLGDEEAPRVAAGLEMAATLETSLAVLDYRLPEPRELHIESYAFIATVQARIAEVLGLELRVPYSVTHRVEQIPASPEPRRVDVWRDRAGAPWLAAYWAPEHVDAARELRLRGRIGLGVSIPHVDTAVPDESNYDPLYARVATAHWDDWSFRPWEAALVIPGALEGRLWRYAYFGVSGAAAFYWEDRARQRATLQLGLEGGVEPLAWLRASVRVTGVGVLGKRGIDDEWGSSDVVFALQPRVTFAWQSLLGWLAVTLPMSGVFGPERPAQQPYGASVQIGLGGRW